MTLGIVIAIVKQEHDKIPRESNNSKVVLKAFKDGSNTTNQLKDGTLGLPFTKEWEVCDLL